MEPTTITVTLELEVEVRNAVNSVGDDYQVTQSEADEIISANKDEILSELENTLYRSDVEVEDDCGNSFDLVFSVVSGWTSY